MYCPAYTYQAELWCPSCGEAIRKELDAAGAECLEAEKLADGSRIGRLLTEYLTDYGVEYVREAAQESPASPVVRFWLEAFPEAEPASQEGR